jgi:hypothetical protein
MKQSYYFPNEKEFPKKIEFIQHNDSMKLVQYQYEQNILLKF